MMNKKGTDTLETLVILILGFVLFVIVISIYSSTGFFSVVPTTFSPLITTGGSYMRGVPVYMIWEVYDYVKMTPVISGVENLFNPIKGAFELIQNSIPLVGIENSQINMGYTQECGNKGVSKEAFMKTVAQRTVDCWSMYTSGRFDPLMGTYSPNPRTCFTIQFNVNEPVSFSNLKDYMLDTSHGPSYMSRIQNTSERSKIIVENQTMYFDSSKSIGDFSKTMRRGVFYVAYGDLNSDNFGNSICSDFEPDPPQPECRFEIHFPAKEMFQSIYDSASSALDDIDSHLSSSCDCSRWDVSCWAKCVEDSLTDAWDAAFKEISETTTDILDQFVDLTQEPQDAYDKLMALKDKAENIDKAMDDLDVGEFVTASTDMKDFVIDNIISKNLEFDAASCSFGEDLLTNAFSCTLNADFSKLGFSDDDMKKYPVSTVTCYFKDNPGTGYFKKTMPELRQTFADLFTWPNFDTAKCGASLSWNEVVFTCAAPQVTTFNQMISMPDHVFWCIDEDATYNGTCNPFSWSGQ